jgi:S1-C subfamily serine protease
LTVRNLTSQEKTQYKVDDGVMISAVKPYSKAADQQLFEKLVIISADKRKIKNVDEFKKLIESKNGEAILLEVQDVKGQSRFSGLQIPKE